jgi:hypothetical protein
MELIIKVKALYAMIKLENILALEMITEYIVFD